MAPGDSSRVAAGATDGRIYITDAGRSAPGAIRWNVTQPREGWVTSVAHDPGDPEVMYATYGGFGGAHVFASTNGGRTWQSIDGIGDSSVPDVPVHVVVVDPGRPERLYLGTDVGVFVSDDGGAVVGRREHRIRRHRHRVARAARDAERRAVAVCLHPRTRCLEGQAGLTAGLPSATYRTRIPSHSPTALMLSTILCDLRVACRSALRQPGFTAVVVVTLALGIGATTAMFALVHATLLKPLPYHEPDRLVLARRTVGGQPLMWSSAPDYYNYREQADAFETLARTSSAARKVTVTGRERPDASPPRWCRTIFPRARRHAGGRTLVHGRGRKDRRPVRRDGERRLRAAPLRRCALRRGPDARRDRHRPAERAGNDRRRDACHVSFPRGRGPVGSDPPR